MPVKLIVKYTSRLYINTMVKLIAFYLPQFHPIPENDAFWGKGYTEWSNVVKAKPNFNGHYQPDLPKDLGFYDLRLPETREQQAKLAKDYGVYGFCYYYYWFNGLKLLQKPLEDVLRSGRPDFPFCICWANENWRRKINNVNEILIKQEYSEDFDLRFIREVMPILKDDRYIRVSGKPLLIVHNGNEIPDPKKSINIWRGECKQSDIGDIHVSCMENTPMTNPHELGFDSLIEFPPLNTVYREIIPFNITNKEFKGIVADYKSGTSDRINKLCEKKDYKIFRTVMPSWDNTPRQQNTSIILYDSNPEYYEEWLRKVIEHENNNGGEFIFINAWNEWGEGCHLEPCQRFGHSYLQATKNALLVTCPHP